MAFGFFKKSETADTIFLGGKIFTQNTDLPWAEAVACRNGLILAVGDNEDLTELKGKNTKIVDLKGGVMLPGYIDTCGHPVLNTFQDSCLFLKEGGLESTFAQISEYASERDDAEIFFAYGYDENIFRDIEHDQLRASLDQISPDRPIVVLGKSGLHCLVNTIALDTVKAAAQEDEVAAITLPYLLSVLEPINLENIPEALPSDIRQYCEKGFTAVFDCGAPEFFATVYQNIMVHLFQENMVKQRFFGSLLITCDVNPLSVIRKLAQYRTNCVELNEYINFNTLKLIVNRTPETESISEKTLRELCLEAGDNGFDIHIDAIGKDAVSEAVAALEATRSAGYRKNAFTVAHEKDLDLEDLADTSLGQDIKRTFSTLYRPEQDWRCIENAESIEEAIDMLTIDAAIQLGINSRLGSIEKSKHADFVVFEQNPFDMPDLNAFKKLKAAMTIIGGQIVYDATKDDLSEWSSILYAQEEEE